MELITVLLALAFGFLAGCIYAAKKMPGGTMANVKAVFGIGGGHGEE